MNTRTKNRIFGFLTLVGLNINAMGFTVSESERITLTKEEIASLSAPPPAWADEVEADTQGKPTIVRGCVSYPVVKDEGESQSFGTTGTKWPGGLVYYVFSPNVNETNKQRFRDACEEWRKVALLTFIEGTGTGNRIFVQSATVNSSSVGMVGGVQVMNIFNWTRKFVICHEIGHALGLQHEHSRSDRDPYVTILTSNIRPEALHNFDKLETTNYGAYDFLSVMHYVKDDFVLPGQPAGTNSIECKPPYVEFQDVMGQRDQLSTLDRQGMADHYGERPSEIDLVDRGETFQVLTPTTVAEGGNITVQGDIRNAGTAASGSFNVDVYLSTNTAITNADTLLGRIPMSSIAAGDVANTDLINVALPAGIGPGEYHVGWLIDSTDAITEINEDNNEVLYKSGATKLTVTAATADIDLADNGDATQSLTPTTVQAGDPVTIANIVRNLGADPSGAFDVTFYLSANSSISTFDIPLGTVNMPSIAPSGGTPCNLNNATVPASLSPGDYYVGWIIDSGGAVDETNENNTVLYKSGNTLLTVTAATADIDLADNGDATQSLTPTTVQAGDPVTIANIVRNLGADPSGAFDVTFYLSANSSISTFDIPLGTVNMPSIAPSGGTPCNLNNATVPANLAPGTYYVGWIIDSGGAVNETNENNTVLYKSGNTLLTVTAATAYIDLADNGDATQSLTPTTVQTGNSVTISNIIRNLGTDPSGAFDVRFYLSNNSFISTGDTLLGTVSMPSIGPAGGLPCNLNNATVPASLSPGDYYVGWIIDSGGAVDETNENNNTVLYKSGNTLLTVTAPTADNIDLEDLGDSFHSLAPMTVEAGGTTSITHYVWNSGSDPSGGFDVTFYLSTNNTITTGDTLLGTETLSSVPAGSTGLCRLADALIPANTPPGDYYIGWIIDSGYAVAETDETNNDVLMFSGNILLTVTDPPDDIDLEDGGGQYLNPTTVAAGETVSVGTDILNSGTDPSGTFDVDFYLSDNSSISTFDTSLGTVNMPSLTGGASGDCDLGTVTVPANLAPGVYHVGCIIDPANEVDETDENTNNIFSFATTLTVTAPTADIDLEDGGGQYLNPTTVAAGETVSVGSDILNSGTDPSGTFDVDFYLSDNPQITTGDTFLGTVSMPSIGASGSSPCSLDNATVPGNLAPGDYYVGWIIDAEEDVNESDETNNIIVFDSGNTQLTVTATPPSPPTNVMASDGTYIDKVVISWTPSSDGTHYRVYRRATDNSDAFQAVSSWSTEIEFSDLSGIPGKVYKYWVRAAKAGAGAGDYSQLDTGYRNLPPSNAPSNLMASDGTYTDRVWLTWSASSDATHYKVYRRATDNSDEFQAVSSWRTATSFPDFNAEPGKVYKYWVRAAKNASGLGLSPYSQLDTGYQDLPPSIAPTNLMASDGTYMDRVWLTWSPSSDATYYKVYRRDVYNSDEFQAVSSWRTATSFADFNAEPGRSYKYWVRAAKTGSGLGLSPYSALDTGYQDLPPADAPTNVTATDGSYTDRVSVVWSPPVGATHYRVFRRASNNSDALQPLSWWREGTSFDDFTAEPGKSYKYWVKAAKSPSGLGASGYSALDRGYRGVASSSDEALAGETVDDPESGDADDTVADPAKSGYEAWASGFAGIPADKAGRLDDADGDGTTNIMELFHGTSPVDPAERGGITVLPRTGDEPVKISLKIGKDTPPGLGEILWSSDRVNWQPAGELTNGVNVTLTEETVDASHPNHDVVEVTATVTYGSPENLYLKLEVDEEAL